jgi:hypothetical protein
MIWLRQLEGVEFKAFKWFKPFKTFGTIGTSGSIGTRTFVWHSPISARGGSAEG